MQQACRLFTVIGNLFADFQNSLVDGNGLQTHFCDPMQWLQSSGYTLSGIYIDDLSWSPRTKIPDTNLFP